VLANLPPASVVIKLGFAVHLNQFSYKQAQVYRQECRPKYGGNMYCPSCGAESNISLKYCKRCGGNLGDATQLVVQDSGSASSRYTGAAWAIGLASTVITLAGLGIIFSHAWDLVGPHYPGPRVGDATMVAMTMIIFGSATIFGIIAMLIRLFTRLMTAPSEPPQLTKTIKAVTGSYTPAQMQASPLPVSSVTEHTTRNFVPRAYDETSGRE
jgi:hypothetical protein